MSTPQTTTKTGEIVPRAPNKGEQMSALIAKMTPELARRILGMHTTTSMTQQEIAFELGVNQGRVNEVIKRGKWLDDDPHAPEAVARDRALARMRGEQPRKAPRAPKARKPVPQLSLF